MWVSRYVRIVWHSKTFSQESRPVAGRDEALRTHRAATKEATPRARRCTSSAVIGVSAALSRSPVRIRMTCSSGCTKIFPSPTSPVRADERIALMVGSTNGSEHAISILTFSRNSRTIDEPRSEEHTSELQSLAYLVCRLLLEKKKKNHIPLPTSKKKKKKNKN